MKFITLVAGLLGWATYTTAFPDADPTACPTTITTFDAGLNIGPTSTAYLSTVTSTSSVDCGGCDEVVVTSRALGHGPAAHFTTTVTVSESTTTAYVCSEGW